MRRLRVLVLLHEDHVVPDSFETLDDQALHDLKTSIDVVEALDALGHSVRQLGVRGEFGPIRETVPSWRPHIVFNLLEEFRGEAVYDHNVVSYLELLGVPYTGCGPRGLVLCRDKAVSKKLISFHRTRVPRFRVYRRGRRPRGYERLGFPLIVKSLIEEASMGIAKASLVSDADKLAERVRFVHESVQTDAIVEEFIDGREIYVGVIGNQVLKVLPAIELIVDKKPEREPLIATSKLKHDPTYQEKLGVRIEVADLPRELSTRLIRISKRIYRALELEGYARIDFRLKADGQFYFLEANPNPEIARHEEVATAAAAAGMSYEELIGKIVGLGLRR